MPNKTLVYMELAIPVESLEELPQENVEALVRKTAEEANAALVDWWYDTRPDPK